MPDLNNAESSAADPVLATRTHSLLSGTIRSVFGLRTSVKSFRNSPFLKLVFNGLVVSRTRMDGADFRRGWVSVGEAVILCSDKDFDRP